MIEDSFFRSDGSVNLVVGTAAVFGCAASPSLTRRFPLRIIVIFSSRFRFEYADDGEDDALMDSNGA